MKLFVLSLSFFTVLIAVTAEASITVQPSTIYASANDSVGSGSTTQLNVGTTPTLATPTHTTLNAVDGNSFSNNTIDWYVNGANQIVFSLGLDQQRTGAGNAFALGQNTYINFHADSNEAYSISGYYKVTDNGATGAEVTLSIRLFDVTLGFVPVASAQHSSYTTPNEQLTLGGTDAETNASANLTGNLIATHDYAFYGGGVIGAYGSDLGASAKGNVTLTIGADTSGATPEPLSLMVWVGLIAATVINTGRRTRS